MEPHPHTTQAFCSALNIPLSTFSLSSERRPSPLTAIIIIVTAKVFTGVFRCIPDGQQQLLRGPRRVVRLCVFALLLPAALITVPLYVRLVLYPPAHYPMMPTDQRLLAHHASSFWCQVSDPSTPTHTHTEGSDTLLAGRSEDGV